ncbi:MAG: hypothetical protein JSU88_10295 [Nitrospinaceae bacterium]|nr:MAG: hypothetical protein JSU88_10295 [Nitrospinaceae bacterium]
MTPGNETAGRALEILEKELLGQKSALKRQHKDCPDNLQAHRVYLTYVSKLVEILKIRVQSQALEPERLLIDTLKNVVSILMDNGETRAPELVGRSLHEIGKK